MVRAPCCEKMGLKRGPWTPEEDQILTSYIQKHGHSNWRALPKQAGLLRCGKSCRLRWINYLRPDIKRGNFSRDEEETIIKLHELIGNRWSAIAAKLPGRTDNEIKNVWHTHFKKRLQQKHESDPIYVEVPESADPNIAINPGCAPVSPQPSFTDNSSFTGTSVPSTDTSCVDSIEIDDVELSQTLPVIEDDFCPQPQPVESFSLPSTGLFDELRVQIPPSPSTDMKELDRSACGSNGYEDMSFWYNMLIRSECIEDISQLR